MKILKILNEIFEDRLDTLPKGSIFQDAKKINGIFKVSVHSWSETIETFEKNKDKARRIHLNLANIEITQPNIQTNKVRNIIKNIDKIPLINVVKFADGSYVIYDGHHRLVSYWLLGRQEIDVNLVET